MIQTLFLAALVLSLVCWGGVGFLCLSCISACMGWACFFLLREPPALTRKAWALIAAVALCNLGGLLRAHNGMFGWKTFLMEILYLASLLVGVKIFSVGDGQKFLGKLCAVGAGGIVYAYWVYLGGAPTLRGANIPVEYMGRMSGPFFSPNHFAVFAGLFSVLCFAHLFGIVRQEGRARVKIFLATACALGFVAVILSGSRIGLLACVSTAGFFMLGNGSTFSLRARVAMVSIAGGFLAASFFAGMGGSYRMLHFFWDQGMMARVMIWWDALAMVKAHVLFGHGLGNFQWFYPLFQSAGISRKVDFAHSDMLQTLVEEGTIGLLLWAMLLGMCWRGGWKNGDLLQRLLMASSAMIFGIAVVDFPLQAPAIGMIAFVLLGGCLGLAQRQQQCGDVIAPDRGPAPLPTVVSAFGSNHFLANRFAVSDSVIATHEPRQSVWPHVLGLLLCVSLHALRVFFMLAICATIVGQIYARAGNEARKALDWDKAMRNFYAAARWNPWDSLVWKGMGELAANRYLFSRKTKVEEATQAEIYFRRSLAIHPRNGTVWLALGLLLTDRGEKEKGIACLNKSLRLNPWNGFFHDMMAKTLIAQGRMGEAKAHLDTALWLYPRDRIVETLLKKLKRSSR